MLYVAKEIVQAKFHLEPRVFCNLLPAPAEYDHLSLGTALQELPGVKVLKKKGLHYIRLELIRLD